MDIQSLKNKEIDNVLKWIQQEKTSIYDNVFQCQTRDVFKAKLDNFYVETKDSLLIAVAGADICGVLLFDEFPYRRNNLLLYI